MFFSSHDTPSGLNALFPRSAGGGTRGLFFCLLPVALLLLPACSGRSGTPTAWNLGDEGKSVYYYLVQQEAAATGDVAAFKEAGDQLLTLAPDAQVFVDAASFALRRREWAEARNVARQGMEKFPDSLPLAMVTADSYMQEKRIDDAVATLSDFAKSHPDNQEARQEMARLLVLAKRHAELDRMVRELPAKQVTPYIRLMHARSLLERNFLEQAEKELRIVVKQDPDLLDAWVDLAICMQLRGKHAEAARLYQQAINRDPENLPLYLRLIDAYLRAKQPDKAVKTLDAAPDSVALQMEAGVLLLEAKQYAAARRVLTQVKNTPGAPEEVYFYLAALSMESTQNTNEALAMLRLVPADNRLAERALRWSLQLLEEAGRKDEAMAMARDKAAANPSSPIHQLIYGQTLSRNNQQEQSAAILTEALKQWPNHPGLSYALAYTFDSLGKKEDALTLMESVIAQEPRNAGALNYVGYTLVEAGRDLNRAHALLQRAVAEAPDDPHIADSLAWAHYQMGSYQEAWKAIRKSISLGGDHPVIWEHYGDIASKIGDKAEAGKGYRNALKGKPDMPDAIRDKLRGLQ